MSTNIPPNIPYFDPFLDNNVRKSSEIIRSKPKEIGQRPFTIRYPITFSFDQYISLENGVVLDLEPESGPLYTVLKASKPNYALGENRSNVWVPCVRRTVHEETGREFLGIYLRMTTDEMVKRPYFERQMRAGLGFQIKKLETKICEATDIGGEEGFTIVKLRKVPERYVMREVAGDLTMTEFNTYGIDDFLSVDEISEKVDRYFDEDGIMEIEIILTILKLFGVVNKGIGATSNVDDCKSGKFDDRKTVNKENGNLICKVDGKEGNQVSVVQEKDGSNAEKNN